MLVAIVLLATIPYLLPYEHSGDYVDEFHVSDFYSDTTSVDRVALVEHQTASFDIRMSMIHSATQRIDLAYFATYEGVYRDIFFGSLLHMAQSGIEVRILLDGMSDGLSRDMIAALSGAEHIALKFYNLDYIEVWYLNDRMHDKYMVVDSRYLVLGGRNIGDQCFLASGDGSCVSLDRDVFVYNTQYDGQSGESVIYEVLDYMDVQWSDNSSYCYSSLANAEEETQRLLSAYYQYCQEHGVVDFSPSDAYDNTVPTNKISLLTNGTDMGPKNGELEYQLYALMLSAENRVLLQSPYFVLNETAEDFFEEIGNLDIQVDVVTNSEFSSSNFPAYSLYLNDKDDILASGATIYEYMGDDYLHTKTFLIDDRLSIIGSYNFDPRSANIDTELMLVIDSEAFTAQVQQAVQTQVDLCLVVDADGGYVEHEEIENREVPVYKQILHGILRVVLIPFRAFV